MKSGWLKENIGPILALITVVGTFALFALAFFLKVDGANEKVLFMVIGALSSIATTVVGYYFGSSAGSARKTELLKGDRQEQGDQDDLVQDNAPKPGAILSSR